MTAPTYDELAALVVALQARIVEQDAEIAELRRQLAASSRNSSKPPSADGLGKPAPKSLRGRSGRKPGHEARTLGQVERPDEVVVHEPGACHGCGAELTADQGLSGAVRRQVFNIPKIDVRVVEHRLVTRRCRCGQLTAAAGPAGMGVSNGAGSSAKGPLAAGQ